jgi:hypothetical protein
MSDKIKDRDRLKQVVLQNFGVIPDGLSIVSRAGRLVFPALGGIKPSRFPEVCLVLMLAFVLFEILLAYLK